MEQTSAQELGIRAEGPPSAASHLKSSWEHGKEAAKGVRRTAEKSWSDLSGSVDSYVKARPRAVALGALGAGLVLGFLTGALAARSRRDSAGTTGG